MNYYVCNRSSQAINPGMVWGTGGGGSVWDEVCVDLVCPIVSTGICGKPSEN